VTNSSAVQDSAISFTLELPEWTIKAMDGLSPFTPVLEKRMAAVIEFSRLNFQNNTGGPFAAGVFERDSGKLITVGVNRVVPSRCSSAHAEIMALSRAQRLIGTYDLGGPGLPAHQLVVNWRPCAMCYGAIFWSGVRSLVIAGDGPEMEEVTGFDEGPVPTQWRYELETRGIKVVSDILREEAITVFQEFAVSQPYIYNARLGSEK